MYIDDEKPKKTKILNSYMDFVDSPRFFTTPFSWLYLVVAVAFLALPIYMLAKGIENEIFRSEGRIILASILMLSAAIAAAFIAFIVAWNGRVNVKSDKLTVELIIDCVADLLALSIKAQGHFIGVFGFFAGLFALIFGSEILFFMDVPVELLAGIMIGSLLLGYGMVWFSKLFKFVFAWVSRVIVKVAVQIFKFVVLHAIGTIYNFLAHVLRQLFDYIFELIQAGVDLTVNGLRVIVALAARLGRFLLAYARSPFKNKDYNGAKVTYNE